MKIRVVEAEVYNAGGDTDGQMDRQTRRSLELLFAILRRRLQTKVIPAKPGQIELF